MSEVVRLLPHESIVYYADSLHCPYGERTPSEIRSLTIAGIERLLSYDVKMIVVACNTATAYSIDILRERYPIPFVAIEPAIKPAALATKSGKIALLATQATLEGDKLKELCRELASDIEVSRIEGDGFVELVEADMENSLEAENTIKRVLSPIINSEVDQLILGCTHYPFLEAAISKATAQKGITIVNPAKAIAARVATILTEKGISATDGEKNGIIFSSSLSDDYNKRLENKFKKYHDNLEL